MFNLTKKASTEDAKYMEAVRMADKQTLREMVDGLAGSKGFEIKPAFHGTSASFNKFKEGDGELGKGIYFCYQGAAADLYALNGKQYIVYLKVNPFELSDFNEEMAKDLASKVIQLDLTPNTIKDMNEKEMKERILQTWHHQNRGFQLEAIRKWLTFAGYNAITDKRSQIKDQILVFNPNQIKLADLITFNKGKPIPISQRFNDSNNDIRY